jgi:DNA-binding MurR/RpiR family transcriptional regulator
MQVADFAMAQPQEIAFRTLAEIGALAGVQPSTLVRFAKALGYSGFSEFQAVFRSHARNRWPDYSSRLEALRASAIDDGGAETERLFEGFVAASSLSLERARDSVDPAAMTRAIALLAVSDCIFLLAARRSFGVAAYLAYALRRLGIRCELAEHSVGLAPEQVAMLGPRDAMLVISFTPYAQSTVELTLSASRRGVPVVAITDSPFSPLIQSATVWLEIAEADHLGFRSLAATFALAATLAVAVARQRGSVGENAHKIPT